MPFQGKDKRQTFSNLKMLRECGIHESLLKESLFVIKSNLQGTESNKNKGEIIVKGFRENIDST